MKYKILSPKEIYQINYNAETCINMMDKICRIKLKYDIESVEKVDKFIDEMRLYLKQKTLENTIDCIVGFLGRCIIEKYGGRWVSQEIYRTPPLIEIDGILFDLVGKVVKQFENGTEDSILCYFIAIDIILKDHRDGSIHKGLKNHKI